MSQCGRQWTYLQDVTIPPLNGCRLDLLVLPVQCSWTDENQLAHQLPATVFPDPIERERWQLSHSILVLTVAWTQSWYLIPASTGWGSILDCGGRGSFDFLTAAVVDFPLDQDHQAVSGHLELFGFLPKAAENFTVEGSFASGFNPTVKVFCKEIGFKNKEKEQEHFI